MYPTERWHVAWNPREIRSTREGGMREGPAPPSGEQDKQLTASRGGDSSLIEQEEDTKKD